MSQDILGKFESGQSVSQTAERTNYRSVRRLYQRAALRRDRLHRILNILHFLPTHYRNAIDFEQKKGQFKEEVKINYRKNDNGKYDFIFKKAFLEMAHDFKKSGNDSVLPYDWTLYYLRRKALMEKISKEELAWVILNFNQKRGYFQLRDLVENEEKEGAEKTYEVLKVESVIPNGDVIKKNGQEIVLYDVFFENGWKYYKPISKIENWLEKTKEFIVTTKALKDGTVKRTFKQVDSEKDWIAIKKKTESEIEKSGKYVGEYIYEHLLKNPKQKIRGKLIKTIERKFYKKELAAILEKQMQFHPELKDAGLLKLSVFDLYPHNEGRRKHLLGRKMTHLIMEDIIFYQRPLKSQKHLIAGCPFEKISYQIEKEDKQTGKIETITVEKSVPVIHKSHPLFEEFRLWQFLHNIVIYQKEKIVKDRTFFNVDVTNKMFTNEDDWVALYDFLSGKKEINQKNIIDFLIKKRKIDKMEKDNFRWNYPEDKKYPAMPVRAGFLNRLKKVKNVNPESFFNDDIARQLWLIIYSVKDKEEFVKALKTFAIKHRLDIDSFVNAFKNHPAFNSDYGAYSYKALKRIVPLMRVGKYWSKEVIAPETLQRIDNIMERLESIDFNKEKLEEVADDEVNTSLLKSFIPFKDKNPHKALMTYQATYAVYGRHSEFGDIQHWRSPEDMERYIHNFKQHSLRNPIVEQIVLETLRTVKDIWKHHGQGKEHFFDEIHLELGRELKNPAEKRKKLAQKMAENERTNRRIKALLKELINYGANPQSPNHAEILRIYDQDVVNSQSDLPDDIYKIRKSNDPTPSQIERYKLWLEQKYLSPYTGKPIPLSKLFTTDYQIEHVIPQSRYFDNSLNNKVIAESDVNQDKSNMTAFEYIKEKGGSLVNGHKILYLPEYEAHCKKYFTKNRRKLKNLLSEDIPEDFINRQLNDTRYISKVIKALLSNIVREDDEQAETSKNLLPVTGAITSTLKHDWGLHDKWNEIILPRFKRLNELTYTTDFTYINQQGIEVPKIPDYIPGRINKKRIDHRHHALDALVIASVTRNHINYINALNNKKVKHTLQPQLLIKNNDGRYSKTFRMPWSTYPVDAYKALLNLIPSFKQDLRVINKATNKYWKWVLQADGSYKKQQVKQIKGDHWAIRKALHKETVYGKFKGIKTPNNKVATFVKTDLSGIDKAKHIEQIVDKNIREVIIPNHLNDYVDEQGKIDYKEAFSPEGIEKLNANIIQLNNGKFHHPIYKVKMYEVGSRFSLSENLESPKHKKYVEAAKGTNLFFAIYRDTGKQKRNFETVPLNEVIAHQKSVAHLPKKERTPIPIKPEKGEFLFSLSPGDLVYVPTDEEIEVPEIVNINDLSKEQINRIYVVNDFSSTCYFTPVHLAKNIAPKEVDMNFDKKKQKITGSFDTKTASYKEKQIKDICWKLRVNRLGNIEDYKR